MFGYVNVYKDELKIKDYNTYRAYYCGLCKMLGKKHGQSSRLALNYDFTFLALLCDSLKIEMPLVSNEGCIKRLGKRKIVRQAYGLEFSADMNLLFAYLKLMDDVSDDKSIRAFFAMLPLRFRATRLKSKYPDVTKITLDSLKRLAFLEDTLCDVVDKIAHEFACILKAMFKMADSRLENLGYVLGRLIYIMDACDDLDADYKKGRYNPLLKQYAYNGVYTDELKESITTLMYNSLSEFAFEYEKLDIKKNKALLDNIVYLGMRARCDLIVNERKCKNEGSI